MKNLDQDRVFDIRESFLASVFGSGVRSADSFAVTCPACCSESSRQHKKKLSIKLADGMHHCWICGLKGKTLQYTIKKYHPAKLSEYLRIFEEEDYNSKLVEEIVEEEKAELPVGFVPLATKIPDDPDHIAVLKYLFSRGLSRPDFYKWRLGTCMTGKFSRRVIMPSFDAFGDLNYFTARSIDSDGSKKYINSKVKRKKRHEAKIHRMKKWNIILRWLFTGKILLTLREVFLQLLKVYQKSLGKNEFLTLNWLSQA